MSERQNASEQEATPAPATGAATGGLDAMFTHARAHVDDEPVREDWESLARRAAGEDDGLLVLRVDGLEETIARAIHEVDVELNMVAWDDLQPGYRRDYLDAARHVAQTLGGTR